MASDKRGFDPSTATLAQALEATRRARQLTQQQAADALGLNNTQVYNNWVNHDAAPKADNFKAICKFLHVTREELALIYLNSAEAQARRRGLRP